jgi:hypothetical protein
MPKPMRPPSRSLKKLPDQVALVLHQYPQASVELWTMDEHQIGLEPILRRILALKGATVKAPVAQRYEWMYVFAFVHPRSGQTSWLLLPTKWEQGPRNRSYWCWIGPAGRGECGRTCIQANVDVAMLELAQDSSFDYWLKISSLEFRKQLRIPVKLADYHRKVLSGKTINASVTLNKREDGWWLTLSYDEVIPVQTDPSAPVVGIDVGIANFLTNSTGKHYGTFHGKLRERQKRDREKRRRKAKLRQCLQKKVVRKLPSTSSKSGQRLARHVRQEMNHAVNQCFSEHEGAHFAFEQLSVATMKYKARAMNAYLYASNLAHIPKQIAWNAAKRGRAATRVNSAYTSQACSVCHYPDRANRPNQQTFCCRVCGFSANADLNASINIEHRQKDDELRACKDRREVKALLLQRHQAWKQQHGWP